MTYSDAEAPRRAFEIVTSAVMRAFVRNDLAALDNGVFVFTRRGRRVFGAGVAPEQVANGLAKILATITSNDIYLVLAFLDYQPGGQEYDSSIRQQ